VFATCTYSRGGLATPMRPVHQKRCCYSRTLAGKSAQRRVRRVVRNPKQLASSTARGPCAVSTCARRRRSPRWESPPPPPPPTTRQEPATRRRICRARLSPTQAPTPLVAAVPLVSPTPAGVLTSVAPPLVAAPRLRPTRKIHTCASPSRSASISVRSCPLTVSR